MVHTGAHLNNHPQILTKIAFVIGQDEGNGGDALVPQIQKNATRYVKLFSEAIDAELPEPTIDITAKADILDVIGFQRAGQNELNEEAGENIFPPMLTRRL